MSPGGETETEPSRVDELNRVKSPRTKAARVHRTADLGGACCTERTLRRSAEGPADGQQRTDERNLPSERVIAPVTAPAAHHQPHWEN